MEFGALYRRMRKRESLIVNSFAFAGLGLGVALFVVLVAVAVYVFNQSLWWLAFATLVLMVGGRVFAGLLGGWIGDSVGYDFAHKKLVARMAGRTSASATSSRVARRATAHGTRSRRPPTPRRAPDSRRMNYVEITAAVPTADAERASEILRAHTGLDVSIDAPFTQADLESDAVLSTGGTALVRAYVADDDARPRARRGRARRLARRAASPAEIAHARRGRGGLGGVVEGATSTSSASATASSSCRRGARYDAQPDDVVLTLDPGMAFGTGQHETTRMCLEALERAVRPGMRVLDVGCGSGILAIAAAKLGAREVCAVDVDPNCVRVTRENAEANAVARIVRAGAGSAGDAWPFAIRRAAASTSS